MFKKTIKYEDFDGAIKTEDFWFNLTAAELIELQASLGGNAKNGFENFIRRAVSSGDQGEIVRVFKTIVLKAYGEKVLDAQGKERFIKTTQATEAFASTEAYSALFMELATDGKKAAEFITAIAPKNAQEAIRNNNKDTEKELMDLVPKYADEATTPSVQ